MVQTIVILVAMEQVQKIFRHNIFVPLCHLWESYYNQNVCFEI
eukprot:UN03818